MADTPKDSRNIANLKAKVSDLESKLKRLKSGELKAGQPEDAQQADLQQEAIDRTEQFIRNLKKSIKETSEAEAADEAKKKKVSA